MLIKINDGVYINPEHISAIGAVGAKKDGAVPMASITLQSGQTLRVLADGLIETLEDAGVIVHSGSAAVTLTDTEIRELREMHEQGFRYIARDDDGENFAFAERPIKGGAYWRTDARSAFDRLEEPYTYLPDLDKEPLSITALLQEAARE